LPKKLTELDAIITTSGSSFIYVVDYSSGSATSNKIILNDFFHTDVASKIYLNSNFK